ncbi:MAG: hypothetical protein EVA75_02725 [Candidatus Pelagibacterales bacterium]|nr:MAG: hypothetical protein EVA75_02725 [Pelagibacterales bacterium]
MNFLVIDSSLNKICFFSKFNNNCYNKSYESTKNNYDQFSVLLFAFLRENNINLDNIGHLFVNHGPGNFSGIRISIATAKGLAITNKLDLYGFNSNDLKNMNYLEIIDLYDKGKLKKNLIKPHYLS